MIAPQSKEKAAAQTAGVKRVRGWLEELLPDDEKEEDDGGTAPDGKETSVIVNQLACKEEGCPDVEVVITLLRAKPRPKLMFKVYKAAAELTSEEVEAALRQAESKEREEQQSKDTHDHGHDEGAAKGHAADGAHGDGCDCGHDHEKEGHPPGDHEHGHAAA